MRRRQARNRPQTRKRLSLEALESRTMLHGAGALSGFVYIDHDADGTRDDGEAGVPGIVVRLSESGSSDASMDRSTITADDGSYSFDELESGTYQLSQRQTTVLYDGDDSTPMPGAVSNNDVFTNIVLADGQISVDNNFGERGLRAEVIRIDWYLASAPPRQQWLREAIALAEDLAGNSTLAESIRAGGGDIPEDTNASPVATDDLYTVRENALLIITAASGVLANDVDPDGDSLTANLIAEPSNGSVTLNEDGSFTYTPNASFSGFDSFTYEASDATGTSIAATVRIDVTPSDVDGNQPFGPVTTGRFDDPDLLGLRTDLVAEAPAITAEHVSTAVSYEGYSSPPTYGDHHGSLQDAQNNNVTPRPTGVYTTEQPDEDLVHNLEHGHVWISYNPGLLSSADQDALEQLVEDGGTDTGVILTPRPQNPDAIALASWAHLQTLDRFDATQIRDFVETNRGHSPEGFIPSGQKAPTAASESLNDGWLHTQVPNEPFDPVVPGSVDDQGLLGIRMDAQDGAPAFSLQHVTTAVDFSAFGNAPSYGEHHGVVRDAQNNYITPRPTGVYSTEQPDEDLVHNLEHGHVWISYNPNLVSTTDLNALGQLVRDGGTNTGVIVTPRSKNTSPIVLTSLTRQLTLPRFNANSIYEFVNTNRGHSPEGFIPSGQKPAAVDLFDDGLSHTP